MKRRTFIKGAVAAAVSAALPAASGFSFITDVRVYPWAKYTHKTYALATPGMDGPRMAAALARSLMQTREVVCANVFEKMFPDSGEGARRAVGVEGSPDRIL